MTDFQRLRDHLATIEDLNRASAVLSWDHHTYMPAAGAQARAEQITVVDELSHNLLVAQSTSELLAALQREVGSLPSDSIDRNLVRVASRKYDRASRIPADLVAEISRQSALGHSAWVEAREKNDFALFKPHLQRTVELSRRLAEHLGYEDSMYDALFEEYEPGMKTAQVQEIFGQLRDALVPLVAAIRQSDREVDDAFLHQPFDEADQERFGVSVVSRFGYDFSRGRQDRTVHPFEISFSRDDVRITTRFDPHFLIDALFSTMHEAGHAMYEQGSAPELDRTPLAGGASFAVHESQSRLWENVVGRSRPFWQHFYPQLQAVFPQLSAVSLDQFYAAINKVQPSFIRVDADEVTYNLHIMLRFEMELGLLEGSITVDEAPAVWNEKMEQYLGIRPPTDTLGILQDVHWSEGSMGYFPTYSLGNILSVQLYEAAIAARPTITEEIGRGEFDGLRGWLTENVYRYGKMFDPNDLIQRATGRPLTVEPYIAYLKQKFGDLYGLQGASSL